MQAAGGFSINTRLQPGAKAELSRSRFNGFLRGKLLKQFSALIAAYTGLKPGVNANSRVLLKMLDRNS
jgi:hypothetical protein